MSRVPHHQIPEDDDLDWEEELIEEYQDRRGRRRTEPRRLRDAEYDRDEWGQDRRRRSSNRD